MKKSCIDLILCSVVFRWARSNLRRLEMKKQVICHNIDTMKAFYLAIIAGL